MVCPVSTFASVVCARPSHADAEQFDERGEGDGRRQRKTRTGEHEGQSPGEIGQMEPLEHGLEHKPFGDEPGLWRHRREAHDREQRPRTEHEPVGPQHTALDDRETAGRAVDPISREEQAALRQCVTREMQQCHGESERRQHRFPAGFEQQGRPERDHRDRSILRR
jgi:hypothetical protein